MKQRKQMKQMKQNIKFIVLIALSTCVSLLSSCKNAENQDPVDYESITAEIITLDSLMHDSTRFIAAYDNCNFDSTHVIITPIGYMSDIERIESYTRFSKKDKPYHKHAYQSGDEINGNMINLYFDDVQNNVQRTLTDKLIHISSISFERKLWRLTGNKYLFYEICDKDTNRDKEIDGKDIVSLYISKSDGTDFQKITPDHYLFEPDGWRYWCKRYYYTALEDVDRNGKFDLKDKRHFYYIDFNADPYTITEYHPLDTLLKK